nr:15590_t:CDS:2 [Entrophospora candida]
MFKVEFCVGVSEGPNWKNSESIYAWIKHFKQNPDVQPSKLVESFYSLFPLKGQEDTLQTLCNGSDSRNGIYQRFSKRKIRDHSLHPIPVLVGGPGTGKSWILQELPALPHNHVQQYSYDNELKNAICEKKMFAINVTFGNGSNVDIRDTKIGGQASVGLCILYEHFIYGSDIDFHKFHDQCCQYANVENFTIHQAFEVIFKDIHTDIKIVILGIDELNALHQADQSSEKILVCSIVRAIGGLSFSSMKRFYCLEQYKGLLKLLSEIPTYLFLCLPLHLLSNDEMFDIGVKIAEFEPLMAKYISNNTFSCCISDIGGQVFHEVKSELLSRYPLQDFAVDATPMMACAILNIPVESTDAINIGKSQITYLDLASLEFNAQFWALHLCLLSALNKKITLKELFGGAIGVGDVSETVIDLVDQSTVDMQSLDYRYPHSKDANLHENLGIVYWNDPTAKQPQNINRKMLDEEYDKYLEGIKKMYNLIGKNSSITNSALLLSTNGRSTSNLLSQPLEHNNYFVVDCKNFRDFYGYTFTS